jgi:hypothetical protein
MLTELSDTLALIFKKIRRMRDVPRHCPTFLIFKRKE